jgi:hypothetical protein
MNETLKTFSPLRVATRIIAVFSLATLLTGCYSVSQLNRVPQNADALDHVANTNEHKLPAFVTSIVAKNATINPSFEHKIISYLRRTDGFSDVIYSFNEKRPQPPYVELSFLCDTHWDLNEGSNMGKGFLTGFTFFLLAPVLPVSYDFDTSINLSATWPNGARREYKAFCAVSAYGTFPYATTLKKFNESAGEASEKCLISVINQLTSDKSVSEK